MIGQGEADEGGIDEGAGGDRGSRGAAEFFEDHNVLGENGSGESAGLIEEIGGAKAGGFDEVAVLAAGEKDEEIAEVIGE